MAVHLEINCRVNALKIDSTSSLKSEILESITIGEYSESCHGDRLDEKSGKPGNERTSRKAFLSKQ